MAGNQYKESWTYSESEKFLKEAVEISKDIKYDFIGEVAREQGTYHLVYKYIIDKFPDLKHYFEEIKHNCESNCFYNGKKGNITPSLAIMNLKSNHGWTDRNDLTSNNEKISIPIIEWVASDKD